MSTKIEWADETWPVVTGCTPVSGGCWNCYAARMAATRLKHHPRYKGLAVMRAPGMPRWTGEVRLNRDVLEQPLRWRKPRMVFVASMGDLFHPSVPDEFISRVWRTMLFAGQHTFQVLTKRPGRMTSLLRQGAIWAKHWNFDMPLPNVWLGVSVENQTAADERIPLLLQTPAAVHYVSVEPMLGPVNMGQHLYYCTVADMSAQSVTEKNGGMFIQGASVDAWSEKPGLDWVICGGESGPGARPTHPDWARSLRDQCQAASVPFFFKQWGAWTADAIQILERKPGDKRFAKVCGPGSKEIWMARVGKKAAGCLLDGRTWQEFPVPEKGEG